MAILSEISKVASAEHEHVIYKVFNDESVDETTSDVIDNRNYNCAALIIEVGTGVSDGSIVFEAAARADYPGTWKQIDAINLSGPSEDTVFSLNASDTAYPYLRARISETIVGGTIDAYIALQR